MYNGWSLLYIFSVYFLKLVHTDFFLKLEKCIFLLDIL